MKPCPTRAADRRNAAQRRTLEAAVLIASAVIQREAKARPDELNDMERVDALFKQLAGS